MIKSKFYLIRGDEKPIYVGFTNRPIKQRFLEHKAGKDFSDYEEVTIEKIDELNYEFTWNEDTLYKNANEVSVREARLIIKYGTQDSRYQKAVGGGVVWSYEKYFVRTNKYNPKFRGMSGAEIEEWIELESDRLKKLRNYINHTIPNYLRKQKGYIDSTIPSYLTKQKTYIRNTMSIYLTKQKSYIGLTIPSYLTKQKGYINHTIPSYLTKQKGYIGSTIPGYLTKQKNYINHTIPSYLKKQKSYIGGTMPIYLREQKNYIGGTIPSYLTKQKNYIKHIRS